MVMMMAEELSNNIQGIMKFFHLKPNKPMKRHSNIFNIPKDIIYYKVGTRHALFNVPVNISQYLLYSSDIII